MTIQTPTHALPKMATESSRTAQTKVTIPITTSKKPASAKREHTVWHLFSRRPKATAFFSAFASGSPSWTDSPTHGTTALKSNNGTRRRSMLSMGGWSRSDENTVESVENKGATGEDRKV